MFLSLATTLLDRESSSSFMRIMHFVSSAAAGGAEIFVRDLSIMAAREEHKITIVFLDRASVAARDIVFEREFLKSLTASGIEYEFMPNGTRKNLLKGMVSLRRILRKYKPDVLHCHLYYAAFFSFFATKVPVIYTHHNYKLNAPRLIYKILDLKISAYIGICFACTELLRSVSSKEIFHINNGVSPDRLQTSLLGNCRSPKPVRIVMVGALSVQKNYDLIINVIARLPNCDVELVVAGEGPEKERLIKKVRELGLSESIDFLGNVQDVPRLLASADIFAMCSAWEGLPIALLEATLLGLPVLVTNVGGCAEVVHSVSNGIVVDDVSPDAYADALVRLVDDEGLRAFFSRNAKLYGGRYGLKSSYVKHFQLYEALVLRNL